jgi:hypothetical protein
MHKEHLRDISIPSYEISTLVRPRGVHLCEILYIMPAPTVMLSLSQKGMGLSGYIGNAGLWWPHIQVACHLIARLDVTRILIVTSASSLTS